MAQYWTCKHFGGLSLPRCATAVAHVHNGRWTPAPRPPDARSTAVTRQQLNGTETSAKRLHTQTALLTISNPDIEIVFSKILNGTISCILFAGLGSFPYLYINIVHGHEVTF